MTLKKFIITQQTKENKMINDMQKDDVILLFEQMFNTEGYSQEYIGEKDFFEFIKRANRDLSPKQRHIILNTAIQMIREGE